MAEIDMIRNFIIGLLIMGFCIFVVNVSVSHLSGRYSIVYDNSSIVQYQSYNAELTNLTENMKKDTINSSKVSNLYDMLGDIVRGGLGTLKMTYSSYDTFNRMSDTAFEQSQISYAGVIKALVLAIVLLVFVFIVLKAILRQ